MAARLFRLLLRLLPAEFRDGYARDAEAAFRAEAHAAREAGRRGALPALMLATAADVLRVAPREHLDILWRDLRVAARGLVARPAHTATAVLTLALGVGAVVAMFAVIHGVLLAPLDYRDADGLVFVGETGADGRGGNTGYLSFAEVRTRARSLTHLVAATQSTATFTGDGQDAERVNAMRVSADYFAMVGVTPALGRAFEPSDDRPGTARQVVVLSDGLWRRRFRADPQVVGRVVDISGQPHTVIGVMPPGFDDLVAARAYGNAALWVPLGYDPAASFACRTCRHLVMFGRLAPGVTLPAAEAEIGALFRDMAAAHPADYKTPGARVQTIGDLFLGPVRPALLLLAAGVTLLFLVACANVASLLLLRAGERTSEVAVRAALGVTRARLIRQLLTEALLLSGLGALAGLMPAWAVVRLVAVAGPRELPRLAALTLDGRAVAVALALAFGSAVVFALVPLRHVTARQTTAALHGAGRRSGGVALWRARAVLVGANVAMATVLLTTSGVLVRSISRLLTIDPGVRTADVLTFRLWAGGARFRDGDTPQQIRTAVTYYDDLLSRLRALPGVEAAAATTVLPLGRDIDGMSLHRVGRMGNPADAPSVDRFAVTADYFRALEIPLVRGRLLAGTDGVGAAPVVAINRTAAETLFADVDPIGQQIVLGSPDGAPRTIVGVVGDVRHRGLDHQVPPQVYVPQAQWAWAETLMTIIVRTQGPPAGLSSTVRAIVRDLDPNQPVTDLRPYDDVVADTTASRRFVSMALAAFAAAALLLAAIGLYGALSVAVAQRRLELGIRVALGAPAALIRRMVFTSGMQPVVVGLALGLAAGLLAVRAASRVLADVRADDPLALAVAAGLLAATGATASALPAWRAARMDPSRALRAE